LSLEITPNDILLKKFSQAMRGYKSEEVEDFLKLVALQFEELLRRNSTLEGQIKHLEAAIQEYRDMEGTLKNTLISSQRIGQEIKEEAQRKSDLIVRESDLEAERIIQKSRQRKERIEEETFQLLSQHKRFRAEFVALMESHGKMLRAQDSRMLLGFELSDPGATLPVTGPEPEADLRGEDSEEPEKSNVGEEEIKDLEILFPEEKE